MNAKNSVQLQCTECKNINYITNKNTKKNPEKLDLNKYCKTCKKTTAHKEIKKK